MLRLNRERAKRLAAWYGREPETDARAYRKGEQWRVKVIVPLRNGAGKTYDTDTLDPAMEIVIRAIIRDNMAHLLARRAVMC